MRTFQKLSFIFFILTLSCTRQGVIKEGAQSGTGNPVTPSGALSLNYSPSDIVGITGYEFSAVEVNLSSGNSPITDCYAAPFLPSGLSINPLNCKIMGVSHTPFEKKTYTITATNSTGSVSTTISLSVIVPPKLKFISQSPSRPVGSCMGPFNVAVINMKDLFVNAPHSLQLSSTSSDGEFFGAEGCLGTEINSVQVSELGFSENFYFKTNNVGTFSIKVNSNGYMGFLPFSQKVISTSKTPKKWIASTSMTRLPDARNHFSSVWTGSEMIVWGGLNSNVLNTGSRYNPATDSWGESLSIQNAPTARYGHAAVWTGTEMVIWGGTPNINASTFLNDGASYNPSTNSWSSLSQTGAVIPEARYVHSAVWTGSKMIVWGGRGNSGLINSGFIYDSNLKTWSSISLTDAPSARSHHSAVWTGSEMIIWGGKTGSGNSNSGARFLLVDNKWTPFDVTPTTPSARHGHSAVWTGSEMIVWGGNDGSPLNDGARYKPDLKIWETITPTDAPSARYGHQAVWTGTEMLVWGGIDTSNLSNGGRYNPSSNSWGNPLSQNEVLSPRYGHTSVWTGSEMLVWGGYSQSTILNELGARFNPATNSWGASLSTQNAPTPRHLHSAVWADDKMIIWGGRSNNLPQYQPDGGIYNPITDTWALGGISIAPSARQGHSAVWTGSEMIIWGGYGSSGFLKNGSRYNPSTDTWDVINKLTPLSARQGHTAVWTGSEMIIWGGFDGSYLLSGARYRPSDDSWPGEISEINVPSARMGHSAVWVTGVNPGMIIWGGTNGDILSDGAIYDPSSQTWIGTTATSQAPSARQGHSAIWTGSEMIIWGGKNTTELNDGAYYVP